jgi:MFS family permease
MNRRLESVAGLVFLGAFFSPVWSVVLSLIGADSETAQYGGVQSLVMGVYNLIPVIPALVCLMLGRKYKRLYIASIIVSLCSIVLMCLWAFGAIK